MDLSAINQKIKEIKRKNEPYQLQEKNTLSDPFEQFIYWFDEELHSAIYDPSAMVVASVDANGRPDARVVLLKELEMHKFIFYTNYKSNKAKQFEKNNIIAINFYWPNYARQVRIRGHIKKVDRSKSEEYFATRPRETQLTTHASIQSSVIANRETLENAIKEYANQFSGTDVPCPEYWGGYEVAPIEYEFFQGRSWRMHDRLFYQLENKQWKMTRLAP